MQNDNDPNNEDSIFGPVIFSYTRAEAIADGELRDVSDSAKEAGIKFPTAVTRAVWNDCIYWDTENDPLSRKGGQDQSGRLWDVVYMARCAMAGTIPRETLSAASLIFTLYVVPRNGRNTKAYPVRLKIVVGPGDNVSATNPDPVVTIMLPDED